MSIVYQSNSYQYLSQKKYIQDKLNANKQLYNHGIKRKPRRKMLCTNGCNYADMWMNCKDLESQWRKWLCETKSSVEGQERFRNCRATCTCDPDTTIKN